MSFEIDQVSYRNGEKVDQEAATLQCSQKKRPGDFGASGNRAVHVDN